MNHNIKIVSAMLGMVTMASPIMAVPTFASTVEAVKRTPNGNFITYVKDYSNNAVRESVTTNGKKKNSKWATPNSDKYSSINTLYQNFLQNALNSYKGKSNYKAIRRIVNDAVKHKGYVSVTVGGKGYSIATFDHATTSGYIVDANGKTHQRFRTVSVENTPNKY